MNCALRKRPRFATEKFDPDIVHAMGGAMGAQTLKDVIHCHGERMAGRISMSAWLIANNERMW